MMNEALGFDGRIVVEAFTTCVDEVDMIEFLLASVILYSQH